MTTYRLDDTLREELRTLVAEGEIDPEGNWVGYQDGKPRRISYVESSRYVPGYVVTILAGKRGGAPGQLTEAQIKRGLARLAEEGKLARAKDNRGEWGYLTPASAEKVEAVLAEQKAEREAHVAHRLALAGLLGAHLGRPVELARTGGGLVLDVEAAERLVELLELREP